MNDDTRPDDGSVSRRTMLKRIGAVGAVAWVTPVISSLNTPAFADGVVSGPGAPCDQPGTCFTGYTSCGTCGPIDGSFCWTDPSGAGFCAEDAYCTDVQTCSPGCPPGYGCAVQTGCSDCDPALPGVCLKLCDPGNASIKHASPKTERHGLTASGRHI